jgi:hypothetical protein
MNGKNRLPRLREWPLGLRDDQLLAVPREYVEILVDAIDAPEGLRDRVPNLLLAAEAAVATE